MSESCDEEFDKVWSRYAAEPVIPHLIRNTPNEAPPRVIPSKARNPKTPTPSPRPVILASRQYPQGGATTRQTNQPIPLSLDGDLCKTQWNSDNVS